MKPPVVVVGLGVHGKAVARALVARGRQVIAVDDRHDPVLTAFADSIGAQPLLAPSDDDLRRSLTGAAAMIPTPGLPDHHPGFAMAADADVEVLSEFDLARHWDDRPVVAITGTNGKTTVTEWVTAMMVASGINAVAAGNTDVPLVTAIDDPATEAFVVEASSFRLATTQRFEPTVATWLNFAPDHLDVHASLAAYEAAKARIWRDQGPDDTAVVNADDPVVARHRPTVPAVVTVGLGADYRVDGGALWAHTTELVAVAELWRTLPHDCFDGLAAAATATAAGASLNGVRDGLRAFTGLAHRVELVGTHDDVAYYDDSKATTPHAVAAAVAGFESVVLIAGGRNKGIDLAPLADDVARIRAVVAIGEAADEVGAAFGDRRPVVTAASMDDAVEAASGLAVPGDAVILSPGCASFDWYSGYGERGDDFARAVRERFGGSR